MTDSNINTTTTATANTTKIKGLFFDRTTHYWTLKIRLDGGKERRIRLKKGQWQAEPPAEVIALAQTHLPKPQLSTPKPIVNGTDLRTYANLYIRRKSTAAKSTKEKLNRVLPQFADFLATQGIVTLEAVLARHVNLYVDHRLTNHKPSSVHSDLGLISGLFSMAVDIDEYIARNPVKAVRKRVYDMLDDPTPLHRSPDQQDRFWTTINQAMKDGKIDSRYYDVALIMAWTGMRVTAAINLRFDWIDQQNNIHVPKSNDAVATKTSGYTTRLYGKSVEVIERRRKLLGGKGRVFPEINNRCSVYQAFRRVLQRYHQTDMLEAGHFNHALRHTFSTNLLALGVPITTIQSLVGHRSVTTTEIYAKVVHQSLLEVDNIIAASSLR